MVRKNGYPDAVHLLLLARVRRIEIVPATECAAWKISFDRADIVCNGVDRGWCCSANRASKNMGYGNSAWLRCGVRVHVGDVHSRKVTQ